MECGYKLFKHDVIKNINLEENRFGFEPEITAKISKLDIKINCRLLNLLVAGLGFEPRTFRL